MQVCVDWVFFLVGIEGIQEGVGVVIVVQLVVVLDCGCVVVYVGFVVYGVVLCYLLFVDDQVGKFWWVWCVDFQGVCGGLELVGVVGILFFLGDVYVDWLGQYLQVVLCVGDQVQLGF